MMERGYWSRRCIILLLFLRFLIGDGSDYYPIPAPARSEQQDLTSSPTHNVMISQSIKPNFQHLVLDHYYGPLGEEIEETTDKLNHYSGVSIIPDDVEQDVDRPLVLILRGFDPYEGGLINNSGGNGGGGGGGGDGGGGGRRKYLVSMFNMN